MRGIENSFPGIQHVRANKVQKLSSTITSNDKSVIKNAHRCRFSLRYLPLSVVRENCVKGTEIPSSTSTSTDNIVSARRDFHSRRNDDHLPSFAKKNPHLPSSESQNRHPKVRPRSHAGRAVTPPGGSPTTLLRVRSVGQEYLRAEKTLGLRKRAHFRGGPEHFSGETSSEHRQVSGTTFTIIRRQIGPCARGRIHFQQKKK